MELLRSLSEAEAAYEKLRRSKKHSAEAIFSQLDARKKGTIDKTDFRAYLLLQYFYSSDKELQGLVARFDRDEDGEVSLRDVEAELKVSD